MHINIFNSFKGIYSFSVNLFKTVKISDNHYLSSFHRKRNISTFAYHYSKTIPKYANPIKIRCKSGRK